MLRMDYSWSIAIWLKLDHNRRTALETLANRVGTQRNGPAVLGTLIREEEDNARANRKHRSDGVSQADKGSRSISRRARATLFPSCVVGDCGSRGATCAPERCCGPGAYKRIKVHGRHVKLGRLSQTVYSHCSTVNCRTYV